MTVIDMTIVMRIVIYFISLFQEDTASDDDMTMIFRKLYFFLISGLIWTMRTVQTVIYELRAWR